MGHVRLGTLPDTRPWRRVVAHLAEGGTVAAVAAATSAAAVRGLERGAADPGVARAVFLLARTALAARRDDFAAALGRVGLLAPPEPGLFDLTAGYTAGLRDWTAARKVPRTDLAEMAMLAGAESLTAAVGERADGLFESGIGLQNIVREFSTRNGFAALAHEFFSRFVRRFLLYHLGRELSQHVGGNARFADHAAHTAFIDDLAVHCREAAGIIRVYAGEWYAKPNTRFERVTEEQARRFTDYCLRTKLAGELAIRGNRNG